MSGHSRQRIGPAVRERTVEDYTLELRSEHWLHLLVPRPELLPNRLPRDTPGSVRPELLVDLVRDFELFVPPAEPLARSRGLLGAQGRAVRLVAVREARRAVADGGLDLDQRGPVGHSLR